MAYNPRLSLPAVDKVGAGAVVAAGNRNGGRLTMAGVALAVSSDNGL